MIRSLRIATLAVLIGGVLSTSAASARPGMRVVSFHGLSLRVPAAWPVYDLAADPSVCVRFNRHAVYLGAPGPQQRCPVHQVGRTDSILVQPAGRAAAAGAPSGGLLPGASQSTEASMTIRGLRVTATWRRSPAAVASVLGLHTLRTRGRSARPRRDVARSAGAPPVLARAASVGTGRGFDPCATPSASAMSAWKISPYRYVGVYLGGTNMACSQPNLTTSWVRTETAAGWRFIPTYVGLQSPTTSCGCARIQPGSAASEGSSAADDAISRARAVGIGAGNPIYFDMEAYTTGGTATSAVRAFLAAWTDELHAAGYLSGVYSSAASGIRDLVAVHGTGYHEPDEVWIADWNGQASTSDPYVPSGDWANHQRLHQYSGGHDATYGGVTINIDDDFLDGAVAGFGTGSGAVPPAFPDGTLIQNTSSLALYRVAGGAPLFVSDPNLIGATTPPTPVSPSQIAAMSPVPADRTFLVTNTGRIFRVAGGAPIAVGSWSVFGGTRPYVLIDEWDIDNITSPDAHLRVAPADGTIVEGLPSKRFWRFSGGQRTPAAASPSAVPVDDAGLQAFALAQPTGGGGLPGTSCVVPSLRHRTLAQARAALVHAHCRLGKVRRPARVRRGHTLRVTAQAPRPRSRRAAGYRVWVRLG